MDLFLILVPIGLITYALFEFEYEKVWFILAAMIWSGLCSWLRWKVPFGDVSLVTLKGFYLSTELTFNFGAAYFFGYMIDALDASSSLRRRCLEVHPDRRVQVLLVAWGIVSFFQGFMGFGVSAALCSVLLMFMGFPATCAAMSVIIGEMGSQVFSSTGFPMIRGLQEVFTSHDIAQRILAAGFSLPQYTRLVTAQTVLVTALPAFLTPMLILLAMKRWHCPEKEEGWLKDAQPLCLLAGGSFTVPYVLAGILLGPEYPTLCGGIATLATLLWAVRTETALPSSLWDFPPPVEWPPHWNGHYDDPPPEAKDDIPDWVLFTPFIILAVGMLLQQLSWSPVRWLLLREVWVFGHWWGGHASFTIQPLVQPGWIFLFAAFSAQILHATHIRDIRINLTDTVEPTLSSLLELGFLCPTCLLLGEALLGKEAAPAREALAAAVGWWWLPLSAVLAAIIGFGSGGDVASNIHLMPLQAALGYQLDFPVFVLIAMQAACSSGGVLICECTVSIAGEFVGLLGRERRTFAKLLLPCILLLAFYVTVSVFTAMLWHYLGIGDPLTKH